MLHETARAKLNLTLEVKGRRLDRYHELESLVAFADFGDDVALEPGPELDLDIDGPFAPALGAVKNLILAAAEAAKASATDLTLGRFRLTKELPIASGLGGGSADAAGALRLLARANRDRLPPKLLAEIAGRLGSDVTTCLASKPALMTGRGEVVSDVAGFPICGMVLANPGIELATDKVYAALDAKPHRAEAGTSSPLLPQFQGSFERLIDYARDRANDLQAPALKLAPSIGEVLASLSDFGPSLTRLSGSGATCFALFDSTQEAASAAQALSRRQPNWWVKAGSLGSA
ncbi:MAG TPA: 4-(cytidine 5'-diphospho)-2-C-methyl-D-erythritol kinase [Methyloceanibacter sp.]|jgi:4-diphosphocytidyl-2-C-methyl-D-erythritol kinase